MYRFEMGKKAGFTLVGFTLTLGLFAQAPNTSAGWVIPSRSVRATPVNRYADPRRAMPIATNPGPVNPRIPVRNIPVDRGNRYNPISSRRISQPPARSNQADREAYKYINEAMGNDKCEDLGNAMRRLSNAVMMVSKLVKAHKEGRYRPILPVMQRAMVVAEQVLANQEFWARLWDRLGTVYRQCDRECFDDGDSVGEMSGLGYCSASVQTEGLPSIGFAIQPPLPLCETSIHLGCIRGYQRAAQEFAGCENYSGGNYAELFREYQGNDCQL